MTDVDGTKKGIMNAVSFTVGWESPGREGPDHSGQGSFTVGSIKQQVSLV